MQPHETWMTLAGFVAGFSKDRSRKTACVLVDPHGVPVMTAWNSFPPGVDDAPEERHQRPAKYLFTEHAERNAIFDAAASGIATRGCTAYMPWYPCAHCARALIRSGIVEIHCVEPDWNEPTYGAEFAAAKAMLEEAGVKAVFHAGEAPKQKPAA